MFADSFATMRAKIARGESAAVTEADVQRIRDARAERDRVMEARAAEAAANKAERHTG
jgi:hypothetical protein